MILKSEASPLKLNFEVLRKAKKLLSWPRSRTGRTFAVGPKRVSSGFSTSGSP